VPKVTIRYNTTGGETAEERRALIENEDESSSASESQELSTFSDVGGDVTAKLSNQRRPRVTCFVQSKDFCIEV